MELQAELRWEVELTLAALAQAELVELRWAQEQAHFGRSPQDWLQARRRLPK